MYYRKTNEKEQVLIHLSIYLAVRVPINTTKFEIDLGIYILVLDH